MWHVRTLTLAGAVTALATVVAIAPPVARPALAAHTVAPPGGCALPVNGYYESLLTTARPHPRIVFHGGDVGRIRRILAVDGAFATRHARTMRVAPRLLDDPVPTYPASGAQTSLIRIKILGYAFLATNDARYARRIRQEVNALAGFRDWTSVSFLGASEIAAAVAMGYSLTAAVSPAAERTRTLNALVDKALRPASCLYARRHPAVTVTHNWGTITNTGMTLAALVVTDRDRRLAGAILAQAIPYANRSLAVLARDGGTTEGPDYAGYMGQFGAYLSSSMYGALGSIGVSRVQTVPGAARYLAAMTGPSFRIFNYADARETRPGGLLAVWNAWRGGDPLGTWLARTRSASSDPNPLYHLWDRGGTATPEAARAPVAVSFPATRAAALRSTWASTGSWLAIKGGENTANHSHLDLGSFVLEMRGVRFVGDYGMDNYALPGYFSLSRRFTYYRTATAGQSTVLANGRNQPVTAVAGLGTAGISATRTRGVAVDLRAATGASYARRTAVLSYDGRAAKIQDKITTRSSVALRWVAHTRAAVRISASGRSATLTRGGLTVVASLTSATPGRLFAAPAPRAPSGGYSNAGWTRLLHDTSAGPTGRTIEVLFTLR